jgi:predicted transcriptional regulator
VSAVVLSIKPLFVDLIFKGEKIFEYRKRRFRRNNITKIIIYATRPISRIVGEAKIKSVLVENPADLWFRTSKFSGVEKSFYDDYFSSCNIAIAYELYDIIQYDIPQKLSEVGLAFAPQSYVYIDVN